MTTPGPVPDAVPVLPVVDLTRAVAFYERLGFVVRASYDQYAIVAFGGAEVHLVEQPEISGQMSWSGVYLRVDDATAVHASWIALGAVELAPPTDQPYGICEFATEDLDGNLWRVGSPIDQAVDGDGVVDGDGMADSAQVADEDGVADGPADDPVHPSDGSPGTTDDAWLAVATHQRCAGCGLEAGSLPARALGAEVRDVVHAFAALLLAADDDAVRRRPAPGTWSALEYGVHVRDLLTVFAERIIRTLAEDEPDLGWWDHEAAIADGFANESDVAAVADDLGRNAGKLSEALRLVDDESWARVGVRRGTERFTIEAMGRFTLHEVVHHRTDAERALGGPVS